VSKIISDQGNDATGNHSVIFEGVNIATLTEGIIAQHTRGGIYFDGAAYQHITPLTIGLDYGTFTNSYSTLAFPNVNISQQNNRLSLSCGCYAEKGKLCEHQAIVLNAILKQDEFRIFFDEKLRQEKFKKFAADYGLQYERDLDRFFKLEYSNKHAVISPRQASLMPVTRESLHALNEIIVPVAAPGKLPAEEDEKKVFVVLKEHKYYKYLFIELYQAQTTKEGKIKNPLTLVAPLDFIWETEDARQLKFYSGINKFQNHLNAKKNRSGHHSSPGDC